MNNFLSACALVICAGFALGASAQQSTPAETPAWVASIERRFTSEDAEQISVLIEFRSDADISAISPPSTTERERGSSSPERALSALKEATTKARETMTAKLQAQGMEVVQSYDYVPVVLVRISKRHLAALAAMDDVVAVTPDLQSKTQALGTVMPPATGPERERPELAVSTDAIGARAAWARGFAGANQVIAIMDDGILATHDMFQGRIVTEACFSGGSGGQSLCPNAARQVRGVAGAASVCAGGSQICDHGSHVAGIAAGYTAPWVDNSRNTANTRLGVAPLAELLPIQVFSRQFTGCGFVGACLLTSASDQVAALNYLIDVVSQKLLPSGKQLVAVNMSFGGDADFEEYCTTDPRVTSLRLLRQLGVLATISSGNDFATGRVGPPACIKEAISVDASTRDNLNPVDYSNSSYTNDIVAPGGTSSNPIISAGIASRSSYVGKAGTSMAAPHVAGAIAILRSKMPNATADEVEWALKKSVTRTFVYSTGARVWQTGFLDVNAAVDVIGQKPALGIPVAGFAPASFFGAINYVRVQNPGSTSGPVNFTLVRDDTAQVLGSFSQTVPARTVIQTTIAALQAAIPGALQVPNSTSLSVYFDAGFTGYAQNILWTVRSQQFNNMTACADDLPDTNRTIGHVHTALLNNSYPSFIRIHNKGSTPQRAVFDVRRADTGALLGTWTTPDLIQPNSTKTYAATVAYDAISFVPDSTTLFTSFVLRSNPSFVVGHVVSNLNARVATDLTTKCRI